MTLEEIAASVLLGIVVMVVVARLMGALFRRIRQPVVVAEILAGLALGPSLLGTLPNNPTEWLFPPEARPFLYVVATLGLVIFMFVVGLELDLDLVRGKGRVAVAVSLSSVALPFTLGVLLGLWLFDAHSGNGVDRLPFVLFMGAAMSVTAFPVLARILTERRMHRTATGALALACAAVDDVLAWILLAAVLAVAHATGPSDLLVMVLQSAAFVLVMFFVVKPRLRALVPRHESRGGLTPDIFAVVLVGALFSSYLTDKIGIHAIFGAFLFGSIMPRAGAAGLNREILERVEQLTVLLLLPVFFIYTGLNVNIAGLGSQDYVALLAVLAVACTGKFVGAALAARTCGIPARRAAALGVLMNTRGLTELVILNVGREAGVLDEELFTILVIMAVVTTIMTEPILRVIYPDRLVAREIAHAERAALGASADFRVVVIVPVEGGEAVVDTARALVDRPGRNQLILVRFDPAVRRVEIGAGLGASLDGMASSFESLRALEARAGADGADVVVQSRASDDLAGDAAAFASSTDADVVVLGRSDEGLLDELLSEVQGVVVWSAAGTTDSWTSPLDRSPVTVFVTASDDAAAALEQAVRIAAHDGRSMVLAPGADRRDRRTTTGVQRRISALGVEVTVLAGSDPLPDGSLTVVGYSDWPSWRSTRTEAATLLVRAGSGDATESLDLSLRAPSP